MGSRWQELRRLPFDGRIPGVPVWHPLCSTPCVVPSYPLDHGQDIRERSFQFACRVVKFCEQLCETGGIGRLMAPQLLDAGTALYAMLEEARAAESRRDFISKCSVGLKEIREAHGRLRIHEACKVGPPAEATALRIEANALVSIVTRIVGNARTNS